MRTHHLLPVLLLSAGIAAAQTVTPPHQGGPQPGREDTVGRDAGPANHPPRTVSPDAVNRGTDGSAAGLSEPNATGITPQGNEGHATAGARAPQTPPIAPPATQSAPPAAPPATR